MAYIDRDTALQILDNYAKTVTEDGKVIVDAVRDIVSVITPTADVVEVKRGYWKQGVPYVCSVCGHSAPDETNTNEMYSCWVSPHCPNCGAKMNGEEAINNG